MVVLKRCSESKYITERVINLKTKDEMKKYGDVVWDILKKAYEYCGGIKNVNGVEDLIADSDFWKLYKSGGEIKACIIYSFKRGGRKLCLLGQDGTPEGKKALKGMLEDDFKLKDRQMWAGFSGKAAITALKHGGYPIPSDIACDLMNTTKKSCVPYDEYWYTRAIKNDKGEIEQHYKLMLGNPPNVDVGEPPKELVDKLIKQAVEFGE
jgi:hypothetical protein